MSSPIVITFESQPSLEGIKRHLLSAGYIIENHHSNPNQSSVVIIKGGMSCVLDIEPGSMLVSSAMVHSRFAISRFICTLANTKSLFRYINFVASDICSFLTKNGISHTSY
jgi:hypothetical protein